MNNNGYYTGYQNTNIGTSSGYPNQQYAPTVGTTEFPMEQSYVENILRLNKGKIFTGVVEQAGRDHLIISDPSTGKWYLILMIYLNYVEFEENINYSPDFTLKGL